MPVTREQHPTGTRWIEFLTDDYKGYELEILEWSPCGKLVKIKWQADYGWRLAEMFYIEDRYIMLTPRQEANKCQ